MVKENKPVKQDKIGIIKNVADRILAFLAENKDGIQKHPKLYVGAAIVFAVVIGLVTYVN